MDKVNGYPKTVPVPAPVLTTRLADALRKHQDWWGEGMRFPAVPSDEENENAQPLLRELELEIGPAGVLGLLCNLLRVHDAIAGCKP